MDKFSVKEGFIINNLILNSCKKKVSELTPSGRERDFERELFVVFSPDSSQLVSQAELYLSFYSLQIHKQVILLSSRKFLTKMKILYSI